MKRFLTIMLCFILCFALLPQTTSASEEYTVTISTNGADYGYRYNGTVYKNGESFTVEAGTFVSGFVDFPVNAGLAVAGCSLSDGTSVMENGSRGRNFSMPSHNVTLTIVIGEDPSLCGSVNVTPTDCVVGTLITANVTGANTDNLVYKWYKGSSYVSEGQTFTPSETGLYTIRVTSPDKTGSITSYFSVVSNDEYNVTLVIPNGVTVATSPATGEHSNGDTIKVKEGTYIIFYAHMPAGATLDYMKTDDNQYLEDGGTIARRMTMPAKDVTIIVAVLGLPEEPSHTHDFTGPWLHDETNHWKKCKECDEIDQLHTHASSTPATETTPEVCSVCDYEMAPSLGHQHANHLTYKVEVPATCTALGCEAYYECSCGKLFRDSTALSEVTLEDIEIPMVPHTYGATVVANEPTCTEEGETEHACTKCGYVERVGKITPTGHNYGSEYVDEQPTCTENGRKAHSCTACGNIEITGTIPTTEHSYGAPYTSKEPTCTEEGETSKKCGVCDHEELVDTIPVKDHTPLDNLTSDETKHYVVCKDCGTVISEEEHYDDNNDGKCDVCDYELPGNPGTDPENPGTDPENPGTDPENPGTDPENPGSNPGVPNTGDSNSLMLWTISMLASLVAICVVVFKKKSNR